MKTRKIVLLAADAVLICVCIVQAIIAGHNPVKTLSLAESPDTINVKKAGEEYTLSLDGVSWYLTNGDYAVNKADSDAMINAIKEIKVLDTVGRQGSEDFNARYDLNNDKMTVIQAKKGDKILRTIYLGKASSTGSQSYVSVNNSKDIYLVSGNLQGTFGKTEDSLRSKNVFSIAEADINSVSVTQNGKTWGAERDTSAEDGKTSWKVTGSQASSGLDVSKVGSWVGQLVSCSANSWLDDGKALPVEKLASVEINTNGGVIQLDVFKEVSGDETKYICTSNKTPHHFELTEFNAKKFNKDPSELK